MNQPPNQMQPEKKESWKDILRETIFEGHTTYARAIDIILILIIIASLIATILETIPSIHLRYGHIFISAEWAFTIIFTIEYILRVICAKNAAKFIFSLRGIIDLISVLPLYIIIFFGGNRLITFVRAIRLLRVGSRLIRLTKDIHKTMEFLLHIKSRLGPNEQIIKYFKRSRKRFLIGYFVLILFGAIGFAELFVDYFSTMLMEDLFVKIISYILLTISISLLIKYEIETWFERYAITNHGVIVSKGILSEDYSGTTYAYMSDTYIFQSFTDKILGIGTVQVKTTGNDQKNFELKEVSNPLFVRNIIHNNIIKHNTRINQNNQYQ